MKVLITGANGFVGRNLRLWLAERKELELVSFTRSDAPATLPQKLQGVDFVFHLAGVNRPQDPAEFAEGNTALSQQLCAALGDLAASTGRRVPVIVSSSIQAGRDNPYGQSKGAAEAAFFALHKAHGVPVHVFRLPNVFGKWCKPNYNSAIATFCHNIARGLPIQVNDPAAPVQLVYVDDLLTEFVRLMDGGAANYDAQGYAQVAPQYSSTVGELADLIHQFKASRDSLISERVGQGLERALYSTYVSYLPPESFTYTVPKYGDERGVFVEMLKTKDSGQFSFFTAHPGITRGGHYHHSKTEKFLVIKGKACFRFRHMETGEFHELFTNGESPEIVETVPGWTHDITNIGDEVVTVMLWANEIFDRQRPDTFAKAVGTTAEATAD